MLLILIPDQYPNDYKPLEIYTGYFDSLARSLMAKWLEQASK